jgi:Fe-S-cluster containining protein
MSRPSRLQEPGGAAYHRWVRAFCLTLHAGYACGRSGACCTAGWPIPIERARVDALRERGLLRQAPAGAPLLKGPLHGGAGSPLILGTTGAGACVFFNADTGRLCSIQRDAGAGLMPSACQHFPRIALRDPRGIFITLSHFCPTAAGRLLSAGRIAIVDAPASLSLDGAIEGLDATAVLPPLLRPGMLMDLDGYSAWERHALDVLDDERCSAREAMAIIRDATALASGWKPGRESLTACVADAFDRSRALRGARSRGESLPLDRPTKAFLASHLFASWHAYQHGGVRAVVAALEDAHARVAPADTQAAFLAAVRAADLELRHMSTPATTPAAPPLAG